MQVPGVSGTSVYDTRRMVQKSHDKADDRMNSYGRKAYEQLFKCSWSYTGGQ